MVYIAKVNILNTLYLFDDNFCPYYNLFPGISPANLHIDKEKGKPTKLKKLGEILKIGRNEISTHFKWDFFDYYPINYNKGQNHSVDILYANGVHFWECPHPPNKC